ncbi:hypothetical protein H7347_09535 [Corynebacterium sp. zg-331]|uniref:hypothetical protein n=1 Tax=unclassified Corynebacterium TaxID=2624378 RepID=UPI00164326C4|nr:MULTISPECIES: hypothetical protein [unclassified Corynebacterium]MBC3186803.1 hypothetical protein [Corynebacterium sp. zg-331]
MRPRLISHIAAGLPIPAMWLIFCLIMRKTWFSSYNGLTMALWSPLVFIGSVICALAAWQEATRLAHHGTAIWLSTPRSWLLIRFQEILGGYLLCVFLPTALCQSVVLLIGTIFALPGYLDLRYGFYALAFGLVLYLLGTLAAHLRLGPLRGAIVALFLGLYSGMYIVLSPASVDTWEIFRPAAWEVMVVCAAILLIAVAVALAARTISLRGSRTTAGIGTTLIVTMIFIVGGQQTGGYLRSDVENTRCESSEEDTLCLWLEDSFKWDDTRAYLRRTRDLSSAAGLNIGPIVAIEPGIPQERARATEEVERQDYTLSYISSYGGKTPSWPASQSFADILRWPDACSLAAPDKADLLYDLLTNFIYGDIAYNGFSTSDPERDGARLDYSQELAHLSQQEQLSRLASALASFTATCSYAPEEFLAHD